MRHDPYFEGPWGTRYSSAAEASRASRIAAEVTHWLAAAGCVLAWLALYILAA